MFTALTHVVLLPLAAVLINDVKVDATPSAVTVDIVTSDPLAASDIRVASGGPRRMYVYVDGTAARKPAFGDAADAIVVHPRLRYTKLEIPTTGRCGEPFGVVLTDGGIRVRATCREAAAGKSALVPPALGQPSLGSERPLPDAPQAALARDRQAQASLKAALALPPDAVEEGAEGEAGDGAGRPRAKSAEKSVKKAAPAPKNEATATAPAVAVVAARVSPPDAPAAAVVAQEGSSAGKPSEPKSGSSTLGTLFGGALLLGLGIVAVLVTRKRGTRQRVIRIVETASIGPRRSLVVARVGARTMVLGVSEAGVALLDPQMQPLPASGALDIKIPNVAEDAALGLRSVGLAASVEMNAEAPSETKNESSLLARLFHRKPRESEGLGREDFEQLFSESLEDEELRRKLAMGESGRVA